MLTSPGELPETRLLSVEPRARPLDCAPRTVGRAVGTWGAVGLGHGVGLNPRTRANAAAAGFMSASGCGPSRGAVFQ